MEETEIPPDVNHGAMIPYICPLASRLFAAELVPDTSTPIHRLPPEILAYTLKFLPEDAVGLDNFPDLEGNWDTCPPDPPPWWTSIRWIHFLQVCRYWRATLLTFPFLWNTVIIDESTPSSDELARFFIDRSGSLPLYVYATNPTSLSEVAHYSERLKDLRVLFTDTDVVSPILSVLTSPAPLLESLGVCYQRPLRPNPDGQSDSPHHTSINLPTLFNRHTPCLRRLYLERIFSWRNNSFANLTHIALQGCETEYVSPQQFSMLLDLLRASPSLEELNLVAPHPWIPDFDVLDAFGPNDFTNPWVSFPYLQRLSMIHFAPIQSSFFLPFLDIPRGCAITFCEVAYPEGGVFASLPNDTSRMGTLQELTSLLLIQVSVLAAHAIATGPSGSIKISADWEWDESAFPDNQEEDENYLGSTYHRLTVDQSLWHFPTTHLTHLWLTGPTESWYAANSLDFPNLPSLIFLRVRCRPADDILEALQPRSLGTSGSILCPQLQTLYICEPTHMAWILLHHCVKLRAERGYRLRHLGIPARYDVDTAPFAIVLQRLGYQRVAQYWDMLDSCVGRVRRHGSCEACPLIDIPEEVGAERHLYWPDWPKA